MFKAGHFTQFRMEFHYRPSTINTLRPRQNGRHFADDIFKWVFLNENVWFPIKISLKFVPKGPINNIPASVQIMAWRRPGDKSLSEPVMVSPLTRICVIRRQWVKWTTKNSSHIMLRTNPVEVNQTYEFSLIHTGTVTQNEFREPILVKVKACHLAAPNH